MRVNPVTLTSMPVVVTNDDSPDVLLAADELAAHLSSTVRPLSASDGQPITGIWLGAAAAARFVDLEPTEHPHGFVIRTCASAVAIVGGSGRGTLYGAYELLEHAGVRWLTPGPNGTVIPSGPLTVGEGEIRSAPHFEHRSLQGLAPYGQIPYTSGVDRWEAVDWYRRQRLDDVEFGAHGIPLWPPANADDEPGLFIHEAGRPTHQVDVTLPEVLDRCVAAVRRLLIAAPATSVISLGPEEGDGFGTTIWDVPGRMDPLLGSLVVTDRYVRFFNAVLDRLADDHPQVRLAFYAHGRTMEPPVAVRPNLRLIPVVAPIAVDLCKSIGDPGGNERRYMLRVIDEWRALGLEWMYRGYLGNVGDAGMPFSGAAQIGCELPEIAARGAGRGIRLECLGGWAFQGPAMYLAAKLMWDPARDPNDVLREYWRAAYGPAARLMAHYFDQLHELAEKAPHAAPGIFDSTVWCPPQALTAVEWTLIHAESVLRKGRSSAQRERVAVIRRAHDFSMAVLDTYRHQLQGAYTEAMSTMAQARTSWKTAIESRPIAVSIWTRVHLDRDLGEPTDQVTALVKEQGPPMAVTPRTWQAVIDDSGGTSSPADQDGRWTDLDAWLTWSAQGLRYVSGAAWCRCRLPARALPGRPHLLLPMVRVPCRAWLNNVAVKQLNDPHDGGPAHFDLGKAWLIDGSNSLVLEVSTAQGALSPRGLIGTGLVFADPTAAWAPVRFAPVRNERFPFVRHGQPSAPAHALPVAARWRAVLDPYEAWARLELVDRPISAEQGRSFDPMASLAAQGLGRYGGGLVIYAVLTVPHNATALTVHGGDATRVWFDSAEAPVRPSTDGWLQIDVPARKRKLSVVISRPRSAEAGSPSLSPHWLVPRTPTVAAGQ